MINSFEFWSFKALLSAVKRDVKQVELAKALCLAIPKVNRIFKDKHHLVYAEVGKWRGALKLKRSEGDYFEMLSIIHAYMLATEMEQERMLQRVFHLAGRLEEQQPPCGKAIDCLVYWLDPMIPILASMVDLNGFPEDELEIPPFLADRISYIGMLGRLQKNIPLRIEITWEWMRKLGAVTFSKELGRWIRSEPSLPDVQLDSEEIKSIREDIHRLNLINAHFDFAHETEGQFVSSNRLTTLTIPSKALGLLEQLTEDFLSRDILGKLHLLCNVDERKRLKKSNPKFHKELMEYRRFLLDRGYKVPECRDGDVDMSIQALVSIRSLIK